MNEKNENILSIREKLVLILVVFLIQIIKPWEYSHQFTKFWDEIKELTK